MAIGFVDPADPVVEKVDFDFSRSGHVLCIVDTCSSHGDLTGGFAGTIQAFVPNEKLEHFKSGMGSFLVQHHFNCHVLLLLFYFFCFDTGSGPVRLEV